MATEPVHLIGNAHLDPAWMWRMSEGLEAFAATCRSALDRIQEFPDFIFTCSSAAHYEFVEETDPKLFRRIQEAVASGRWDIVGGWWVQSDCNLPSGESFVRQALLGQRYFQSRFGKIATVGYNVDSFGHNANLPQLLRKAGLESYVFMRPDQSEKPMQASLFEWQGPSGDSVTAYRLPLHYSNHQHTVGEKLHLLHSFDLFTPKQPWMIFYGVGNHGGGPTIEQLREIIALKEDGKNIEFSSPSRFFSIVDAASLRTVKEEIQPHAIGCYSAMSEMKRLNRRAENALGVAESVSVLAKLAGVESEVAGFERAWKNVCFNQFHDILGGVAIREASDDAITLYREAIAIADRATRTNVQRIASLIDTSDAVENLIVFNPSAFAREELIEFELWHPEGSERGVLLNSVVLTGPNGEQIATQKAEPSGKIGEDRARFIAKVNVQALGWSRHKIERHATIEVSSKLALSDSLMTNGIVKVDLALADSDGAQEWNDELGESAPSQSDSHSSKPSQVAADYRYTPPIYLHDGSDTWAHGLHSFDGERQEFEDQSMEIVERGPIRCTVEIASEGYDAELWERLELVDGEDYLELRAGLDWRQQRSILKFRFPHGCKDPVARYEIPYASIERPIGPNEWPGQSWVDGSERDGSLGLSIISDSKYSYSVDDTYIYVIVARSALYAHHAPPHAADVHANPGAYLDHGWQEFTFRIVPHRGDWREANLPQRSEQLLRPLIVHTESGHSGELPSTFSGIKCTNDAITIGAIKQAEQGDAVIVRAVENCGSEASCTFDLPTLKLRWSANFSPSEIKTFRIANGKAVEVDLLEREI